MTAARRSTPSRTSSERTTATDTTERAWSAFQESTFALIPGVSRAQGVVFADRDANDFGGLWQLSLHTLEDEAREVLPGWDELSVTELGHIEIDVAVIEPIPHLLLENPVEHAEIDDESGLLIDRPTHCHVADIGMSVKVGPGACAKRGRILRLAPLRPAVAMRRGEGDSSGEESGHGGRREGGGGRRG